MASSLLELTCWCQLDSLLNIFELASTTDTQYTSNHLQLLSDPADPIFEIRYKWSMRLYKAFIKLCTEMHFIKSLWEDNLVVITPIYKKAWYHRIPHHVRGSNTLLSSLYSNVFVRCECLFASQ